MAFEEIEKPKLVKATETLAKKFRDMERFPRDRDLSPARMEFLRRAVREKEFRGAEWVTATCRAWRTAKRTGSTASTLPTSSASSSRPGRSPRPTCSCGNTPARRWRTWPGCTLRSTPSSRPGPRATSSAASRPRRRSWPT